MMLSDGMYQIDKDIVVSLGTANKVGLHCAIHLLLDAQKVNSPGASE